MKVKIDYHRSHFEEVCFYNNYGNYFKSVETKSSFKELIISLIIFLFFLSSSIYNEKVSIGLIGFSIVFIVYLIYYFIQVRKLYFKKKEIYKYLNELDKIAENILIFDSKKIEVIQDGKSTFEVWEKFTYYEISEIHIYLISKKANFLIPKKSMLPEDFGNLSDLIVDKIKL